MYRKETSILRYTESVIPWAESGVGLVDHGHPFLCEILNFFEEFSTKYGWQVSLSPLSEFPGSASGERL